MSERVDREALKRHSHAEQWRFMGAVALFLAAPVLIGVIVLEGPWSQAVGWVVGLIALVVGAGFLWWLTREPSLEQQARRGLTDDVAYRAKRCLQLEDVGDHGPLYLVELDSGEALYVGGQWLAHLEPVDDEPDPAENAPRRFPCTEFVAVRRKTDREILDLRCGGQPLHPEAIKKFFDELPGFEVPESGDVLPSGAYEDLKRRLPEGRLD